MSRRNMIMKYLKMMLIFLVFSFLGCSEKVVTKVIKVPCPKLRTWDFNTTVLSYKLLFKTDENNYIVEKKEFMNFFNFVKELKKNNFKLIEVLKLYKKQNEEFNKLRKKGKNAK